MDQQSYNGWTNHATWLVNLWITNDEYTEEGLRMAVRYGGHEGLRDYVYELLVESGIASGTMWYDLITSCLSDVDWREIAGHYKDEDDTDNRKVIIGFRAHGTAKRKAINIAKGK